MPHFTTRLLSTVAACAIAGGAFAQIPAPSAIPGKEYSNHQDEDATGTGDFLQNIWWDGLGVAADAWDYSGSGMILPPPFPPDQPIPEDPDQVDALANEQDFLYRPFIAGQTPMLVSFTGEPNIWSHDLSGNSALWASGPAQINAMSPPDDVDALEIYDRAFDQHDGLSGFDANHYSISGDHLPAGTPGVSVFFYDPNAHASSPYIFHNQLLAAVQNLVPGLAIADIDALMVDDVLGNAIWEIGDSVAFSLRPNGLLDGGEIFVWTNGGAVQYLMQGGRIWDTANPVGAIFGVNTEDINALEAIIPAPGPIGLFLIAGAGATLRRRLRA